MANSPKGQREYLAGITPEPYTVLGVRLRPLSIGHIIWLERMGCDPVATLEELCTAVLICSHRCEEIQDAFNDRWLSWKLTFWRHRLGKINLEKKLFLWGDYLRTHTVTPSVTVKEGRGEENATTGTPFLMHLKVALQSQLGYTPAEALNCPFNQAVLEYYIRAEMEGGCQIRDDHKDREMQDAADSMDREEIIKRAKEIAEKESRMGAAL